MYKIIVNTTLSTSKWSITISRCAWLSRYRQWLTVYKPFLRKSECHRVCRGFFYTESLESLSGASLSWILLGSAQRTYMRGWATVGEQILRAISKGIEFLSHPYRRIVKFSLFIWKQKKIIKLIQQYESNTGIFHEYNLFNLLINLFVFLFIFTDDQLMRSFYTVTYHDEIKRFLSYKLLSEP